MQVKKAFKYRLKPNKAQQNALTVQFGHSRFVYNWALDLRQTHYKGTGEGLSGFMLNKELTTLKQGPDYAWLKEADAQVLQQKTKDLDRAYTNFFEGRGGYPTFKKKSGKQSIRYPQRFKFAMETVIYGKRTLLLFCNPCTKKSNIFVDYTPAQVFSTYPKAVLFLTPLFSRYTIRATVAVPWGDFR